MRPNDQPEDEIPTDDNWPNVENVRVYILKVLSRLKLPFTIVLETTKVLDRTPRDNVPTVMDFNLKYSREKRSIKTVRSRSFFNAGW